ncbi:MAG: thioredoxin domain-containing protein, partial [Candidatus Neomarinimicrobiota bacterium]
LQARFDTEHGGFGEKPKFPTPHQLLFLLRHWHRTGDAESLTMVEKTLEAMRLGGIYDHVGFGFHRYSTDRRWHVPHFEKMLYDQAMLVLAYTEAYLATGKATYAHTVEEIWTYVERDMTAPEGGFYSAEDADSEGEEGKFYLWTEAELRQVLTAKEAEMAVASMNVASKGNFRDEATGQMTGDNILYLAHPLSGDKQDRWEAARRKLLAHREERIRPQRDDKILTDWNGLMISALARAGQALDQVHLIAAAEKAAGFLLAHMRDDKGRLLHRYRSGNAGILGHLDDYAFLTGGLLDLYEATFDASYLRTALELNGEMLERFWDDEGGGLFFTSDDGEALLVRSKEIYDGAVPSGNSVAAMNLIRLGRITSDPALEERAAAIGRTFARQVSQAPTAFTQLLSAVAFGVGPSWEVVIAGERGSSDAAAMLAALRRSYHPNKVVIFHPQGDGRAEIAQLAPFVANQTSLDGKATAYVCRNYACKAPTTDVVEMLAALDEK